MNNAELAELREYTTAINNMLRLKDYGAIMWLVDNMPRSLAHHVKPILEITNTRLSNIYLKKLTDMD